MIDSAECFPDSDPINVEQALTWAIARLQGCDSPTLIARQLLAQLLGKTPAYLLAFGEKTLSPNEATLYQALIARAAQKEPLPYLLGRAYFRHLELEVSPAVLIPRPETELLVDLVIASAEASSPLIVDVGTGTGCIAIALATELPQAQLVAIDISADALKIAIANAQRNGAQIDFLQGSLLEPLRDSADLIVANLPYITDEEWLTLEESVKQYEPTLALRGGDDGLRQIELLLQQAVAKLKPSGAIFLEIGWQQGEAACAIARRYFPLANIQCHRDESGRDRIVSIELLDGKR